MSAFDDLPHHIRDAVFTDIAEQLLQDWIDSNLDEGEYYCDLQVAYRSGDKDIRKRFNEYYNLTEADDDYFKISN